MKITQIDVFQVDLPYSGGVYLLSGGREYRSFDATIVRIETDDGIEGWGESTPFGSTYIAAHARGVRAGIEERGQPADQRAGRLCRRCVAPSGAPRRRCFDQGAELYAVLSSGFSHIANTLERIRAVETIPGVTIAASAAICDLPAGDRLAVAVVSAIVKIQPIR